MNIIGQIKPSTGVSADSESAQRSMAKRKQNARSRSRVRRTTKQGSLKPAPSAAPEDQISYSSLSLHALFEQQARLLIDRADLDEEQKQKILLAMSCPCCGGGAMSFTAKLRR
jgi:hypothetical protein